MDSIVVFILISYANIYHFVQSVGSQSEKFIIMKKHWLRVTFRDSASLHANKDEWNFIEVK